MIKETPAFPTHDFHKRENGMTLRDYFAAKAMQVELQIRRKQFENENEDQDDWDDFIKIAADCSYTIADAMLKARNK